MFTLKLIAITLIVTACSLFGFCYSAKLIKQSSASIEAVTLLTDCLFYIKFENLSTNQVLKNLNSQNNKYINIDCFNQIISNLSIEKTEVLFSNQIKIINSCLEKIKNCSKEEIERGLTLGIDELKKISEETTEQNKKKINLFNKLGILCGMFFAIMLI